MQKASLQSVNLKSRQSPKQNTGLINVDSRDSSQAKNFQK